MVCGDGGGGGGARVRGAGGQVLGGGKARTRAGILDGLAGTGAGGEWGEGSRPYDEQRQWVPVCPPSPPRPPPPAQKHAHARAPLSRLEGVWIGDNGILLSQARPPADPSVPRSCPMPSSPPTPRASRAAPSALARHGPSRGAGVARITSRGAGVARITSRGAGVARMSALFPLPRRGGRIRAIWPHPPSRATVAEHTRVMASFGAGFSRPWILAGPETHSIRGGAGGGWRARCSGGGPRKPAPLRGPLSPSQAECGRPLTSPSERMGDKERGIFAEMSALSRPPLSPLSESLLSRGSPTSHGPARAGSLLSAGAEP